MAQPENKTNISYAVPLWVSVGLVPFIQLAIAFTLASLLVLAIGQSPIEVLKAMITGATSLTGGIQNTLFYATTLIFTGLAVMVAFHGGLFNIGGEGQMYLAGLGVALACLGLDSILPAPLMFVAAILMAMLFGSIWAGLAGFLQAKRGAHVVVTTIMLNLIAGALMNYVLRTWLAKDATTTSTRSFQTEALLPKFQDVLGGPNTPLNMTFFLAIAAAIFVWWLMWRSKIGYEIRVVGQNPNAATYAGISVTKIVIVSMLISGALAGLGSVNVVYGDQGRLNLDFVQGAGFMGIAVALMGRNHPFGVVLAAVLFGALTQGRSEMQFVLPDISPEFNIVIQGLIVFIVAALDGVIRKPVERLFLKHQGA